MSDRKMLSFRLRNIDDDLRREIAGIKNDELSELCRNGLRLILGMKKTRSIQVREKLIETRSKPNLFTPQKPR
jgi:hypothetical protein